ncbi:MAG TPA: type II secretion system F family protein [Thermoplasmata archaeon]|jgi:flagellar protein FlaJ|nr:type II secretion system F family protein [Thermoplasmata archaeon]HYB79057.1 type II secretion system F family protein [Thermoplasmata archaeon]
MATELPPASVRKVRSILVQPTAVEEGFSREMILLIVGGVVAAVFWVVAALNYFGTITILLAPGEPAGANPAIDFFVLGMLCLIAPYGFAETARLRRISKIEERLPDFLRDVAEAGRFGMTLPDAIVVASTGRYGLLTDEIKKMASQIEWGVPVAHALDLFEQRVPTPLTQRVVSIVTRANEAGGNVADVLTMVAHDTREAQLAQQSRQISMLTYVTVIYISFFVFLVTIYIMAAVFLPQMITAGCGVSTGTLSNSGAITLAFQFVPVLFLAFMVAVIVHAVGDGIMAGVLFNGRIPEGLQHATIMLAAGWLIMRFVVPPLVPHCS